MPFKDLSKFDLLDFILFYLRCQASRVENIKYDEFYMELQDYIRLTYYSEGSESYLKSLRQILVRDAFVQTKVIRPDLI